MQHIRFRKYAGLAIICLIWGTTWIAIKYSLQGIPPFLGAALRFALAAGCLYVYARSRRISLKLAPGDFKHIFSSAVFLYLLDYGLIYWGEQYLYGGVTAVFFATFPLFTALISTLVFKSEPLRWQKLAGLLLAFGGISLIFYDQLLITRFSGWVLWATIAIVLSARAAAVSLVIVKKHLSHLQTASLTLHQMLWGVVLLAITGVLRGEPWPTSISFPVVLAVLYLGIFGSAIAFLIYYSLLKQMSAVSLSSMIYVTPLVAIVTGWLLLGEAITLRMMLGTAIVLGGIAVSQLKRLRDAART